MTDDSKPDIRIRREKTEAEKKQDKVEKLTAGIFFTFVTAIGLLSGFGISLGSTKKLDSKYYKKGTKQNLYELHESGTQLARRALLRASIYSVSGVSLVCLCIWKLSGANNFEEFRQKAGSVLPRIKKPKDSEGRTEFENLTELFNYVIEEDKKNNNTNKTPKNEA